MSVKTELGYSASEGANKRKLALRKGLKAYGKDELIKKVNALVVLNKSRPKLHKVYAEDLAYVQSL